MKSEGTITIDRKVLNDMIEEFQLMKESLELMQNEEVMESLKRSKEQIKNKNFADWNELQNSSN